LKYVWDSNRPRLGVISCNPSAATDRKLDFTLMRTINQADLWGYGSIEQGNLSPFYETLSSKLQTRMFARDDDNLAALAQILSNERVWLAWGQIPPCISGDGFRPTWNARIMEVLQLVHTRQTSGLQPIATKLMGPRAPAHPSRLSYRTEQVRIRSVDFGAQASSDRSRNRP
jgi:hypothetical protein